MIAPNNHQMTNLVIQRCPNSQSVKRVHFKNVYFCSFCMTSFQVLSSTWKCDVVLSINSGFLITPKILSSSYNFRHEFYLARKKQLAFFYPTLYIHSTYNFCDSESMFSTSPGYACPWYSTNTYEPM